MNHKDLQQLVDKIEIDSMYEKEDCPFTGMIKNVNDNQRQKTSVEEE